MLFHLIVSISLFLYLGSSHAYDAKYCSVINRDTHGVIKRSSKVLVDFQKLYPCPSTGKDYGACPGWSKDHIIPLACGGCDSITNLQWLPNQIKNCAGTNCKDRFERKIYKNNYCK